MLGEVREERHRSPETEGEWTQLQVLKPTACLESIELILSIVDVDGEPHFTLQSTELMDNSIKLVDNKGKTVASCRKERFGPGKIVNICVKNGKGRPSRSDFYITQYLYHFYIPGWTKKTEGDIIRIITKVDTQIVV